MKSPWNDFRIDKTVILVFYLFLSISMAAGWAAHAMAIRLASPLTADVLAVLAALGVFAATFKWNLRLSAFIKSRHRK